ncbi:hypothetical protein BASA81_006198 [Batrachochytrium salamandrivorans]|nr:hypothetical protein BASA81_006198 [Batrachochytrium salamandrivorans]
MTLERDLLLKQLDQMGKEYDVLAGKVLVLGRDKDQLELDKMELTQRLFVRDNVTTAGRQQQQSIGCFCVIASPALFVDHELDESLIANPVQIASTEYLFDWVDFRATPESIVNELPQTWLDSVLLCTTDRTLVLVGETLGGKTLLLEGFTSPRRNGVYHLLCHRLLDMLGNSGPMKKCF